MPRNIPVAAALVAGLVVIGAVLILTLYKGDDKVVIAGLYSTVVIAVFGYLQSATNTGMQVATNKEVKVITEKVEDNTALTLETQQTGEKTHLAVNSRMDELIERVAEQGRTLAELAAVRGRAEGIKEGLQQAADAAAPAEQE